MVQEGEHKRIPKHVLARLIKKSMKGDLKAFNEVYQIFIKTIYFNVSCALNDKADIDDAIQQIVISMFKGLSQLESPYAFHSYLYKITTNVCWKLNQKEEKHRHSSITELEEEIVDDKNSTPEESWEQKQNVALVRQFIARLPEKQRYALMLYYYHDLSYKDIAEAMDTDINVVGSNIYRAKQSIKQMWEEFDAEMDQAARTDRANRDDERSFNSMFAVGLASCIDTVIEPEKIDALWQACIISTPQLFVVGVGVTAKQATLKTVVAGVSAAVVVACLGAMVIQNILFSQETPSSLTEVQPALFLPDEVSIIFFSDTTHAPEIYNPTGAIIKLSEGTPQTWQILNSEKTIVASGSESILGEEIFRALPQGTYLLEWTVVNDEGSTGIARREFIIEDI